MEGVFGNFLRSRMPLSGGSSAPENATQDTPPVSIASGKETSPVPLAARQRSKAPTVSGNLTVSYPAGARSAQVPPISLPLVMPQSHAPLAARQRGKAPTVSGNLTVSHPAGARSAQVPPISLPLVMPQSHAPLAARQRCKAPTISGNLTVSYPGSAGTALDKWGEMGYSIYRNKIIRQSRNRRYPMTTISVTTGTPYEVRIARGILKECGAQIAPLTKANTCAIITDDNVNALYADTVEASLVAQGFRVVKFVFPHGEASKCATTLLDIYSFLCKHEITRSDCLVALGGGVVGDITGFAAATFLRGMQYVQIPTSLLAQVDSSVGGKTAIDLPEGKNLVGAFKQPAVVLCDPDVLATLPRTFLSDGMGEVIKYGMIRDAALFGQLCTLNLDTVQAHFDTIIPTCIGIKRDVVEHDEFDTGERMILNFGHTLGHAVEAHYHYETYTHGSAVAAGMCLMTKYCGSPADYEKLCACVQSYGLPCEVEVPAPTLAAHCGNDKKRAGAQLRYVVCPEIGTAEIRSDTFGAFCGLFGAEN